MAWPGVVRCGTVRRDEDTRRIVLTTGASPVAVYRTVGSGVVWHGPVRSGWAG